MLKYSGILIIFVSMVYAGRYRAYTYRQRDKQLRAFSELTAYITSRIEFYNERLDEIYAACPDFGMEDFTSLLKKDGFEAALGGTVLYLSDDETAVLREFGAELGKSMRGEQLKLCAYTSERLKVYCEKCAAELPKKVKLSETLSLLCGLMAVILLI